MLFVPCLRCYNAVRVIGDVDSVTDMVGQGSIYWPDKYICVFCEKACEGMPEIDVDAGVISKMKVLELSPEEMLAAQAGLGIPDEMQCDAATVRELLKKPVKRVHGNTVPGTTRFCLTMLELEDGTRIFLGASAHGAVVYRISRAVSYTEKALEAAHA